jgi:hypothetical protein
MANRWTAADLEGSVLGHNGRLLELYRTDVAQVEWLLRGLQNRSMGITDKKNNIWVNSTHED